MKSRTVSCVSLVSSAISALIICLVINIYIESSAEAQNFSVEIVDKTTCAQPGHYDPLPVCTLCGTCAPQDQEGGDGGDGSGNGGGSNEG